MVSYDENAKPQDTKDFFICYGSALRRENKSYFSSLSKLFIVQKDIPGGIDFIIDGQPKINVSFFQEDKPSFIKVNGKKQQFIYKDNQIKITNATIQ